VVGGNAVGEWGIEWERERPEWERESFFFYKAFHVTKRRRHHFRARDFFRVVFILQSGGGTTYLRIYKVFSIILYPYTTVIPFIYSERELLFFR
jgi:hypothetical protein